MSVKLKKEVIDEINKFEDPEVIEKTMAAALTVAERLNRHTNRLNMISDIKLIATIVDSQPSQLPASQMQACTGMISGKVTITDAMNELRAAIDDLTDAKQRFHAFLMERLEGFMLPPEKDNNNANAVVLKATAATSPLAQSILYSTNGIQGNTYDIRAIHKEIEERLMV